ncbi:MAG: DNA primase catalytic subunit PriS [Candidatus Marsarchaeota archaeon]|nr:DNA primase catalytic subunit PriS [Candidatus Marsarchaeota archaeon]
MIEQKEIEFAGSLFKKYYAGARIDIEKVGEKEFGFGDFNNKISFRHFAFKTNEDFNAYLKQNGPGFVSFSSAFYMHPAARPMPNKIWNGSELIFDLDANDLGLRCVKEHGGSWVCKNCFDSVRRETLRLIEEFLIPDFGFSKNEISINFSGNRGYHVHVDNGDVLGLGSDARKQISGYIKAEGLDLEAFFPSLGQRGQVLHGPAPGDFGYGGKLARFVISMLNREDIGELLAMGIEKQVAKKLLANKTDIIMGITTGNWDKVNLQKKREIWKNLLQKIAIRQSNSIDKNVTNDIHHLIRVPGTLHGDTGLASKTVPLDRLQDFDPMEHAVAFASQETVKIHVGSAPRFSMKGGEFGPFDGQDAELPLHAALYLILKGRARLK